MLRSRIALCAAALIVLGVACQPSGGSMTIKVIPLGTLNGSGVSGQATLIDLGNGRTRVEVRVSPAGNMDMPSHIHPGTCTRLVPQPKYPLENVKNGFASTEIAAGLRQLLELPTVVMTHKSNDEMAIYTSCGEIR